LKFIPVAGCLSEAIRSGNAIQIIQWVNEHIFCNESIMPKHGA